MIMDPHAPVADGICFDDVHTWPTEAVQFLANRGVLFSTSFAFDGVTYCGHVIAPDWARAQDIAFGRGLGECVVGRVVEVGRV